MRRAAINKGKPHTQSNQPKLSHLQSAATPEVPPQPLQQPSAPSQKRSSLFRLGQKFKPLAGPFALLWLLLFCTGTGIAALLWLMMLPPAPDCKHPQQLGLDADRLYCAEQATRSGGVESLVQGLELVKGWSADHPLHTRAMHLADEWSSAVLDSARMKATGADLTAAIALAQKIPSTSRVYADAKAAITSWQKDLNRGQALADSVQTAMKAGNWGKAIQQLRLLAQLDSGYWAPQIERMRQQISSEEIAAKQLKQARALAQGAAGNVQVLGRAIALTEQINPDTYAAKEAKAESERWTGALFAIVAGQLPAKISLADATTTLQRLPRGVPTPDAVDVLWFSRAQPLVTDPLPRGALYQQLWQLWLVSSQVRQIRPDSPLYAQAKAVLPKLQAQIQDVTQLNAASALASLGQIPSFQLATYVAGGIQPERPRRIYAQTLITMWHKEIERVQDRPYLVQANQLAATQNPAALQQAIAFASQIVPGRALRTEAKMAIAQWTQQIQIIEDEPVLKRAQTLASQQQLNQAIQTASQIRPGRALYKEAQAAIAEWIYQSQVAVDRPILDRANSLADQGNLSAAIRTAAQIGPGRALYGTAQKAIADWTARQTRLTQPSVDRNILPELAPDGSMIPSPSIPLEPATPAPYLSPTSPPSSPEATPSPSPSAPGYEVPTLPANSSNSTPDPYSKPSPAEARPSGSELPP